MARPREFVESDVIDSAGEVFAAKGLAATTLDELVTATGLGKQSLYNAFGGKRELFLRALSEDRADAARAVSEALESETATPMDQIRGYMLRTAIEMADGTARMSLTTRALVEATGSDDALATDSRAGIEQLAGIFDHCLQRAQDHGQLAAEANTHAVALFFVAVCQGMELMGRSGVGHAALTAVAIESLRAAGFFPDR